MSRALVPRRPPKREWSGLRAWCPICHRVMSQVLDRGRKVYECPECLDQYGEKQMELFG